LGWLVDHSFQIIKVIKSRRIRWVGYVACMGEKRDVYKILVGKSEGKIPLGRRRHRWEDNKMVLKQTGWENVDCIHLAQDRTSGRLL
jgi:hypothetical protein